MSSSWESNSLQLIVAASRRGNSVAKTVNSELTTALNCPASWLRVNVNSFSQAFCAAGFSHVNHGRSPQNDAAQDCAEQRPPPPGREDGGFWRLGHAGRVPHLSGPSGRANQRAHGGAHRSRLV